MHQQLSDLPPLPDVATAGINETDWLQQARECRAKSIALQARHIAIQQNRLAAQKALQLLDALQADTVMLNAKKQRWIEEQRYLAEKQFADNTPAAQQKLQVQIALLQKEVELYEALAGSEND